MPSSPGTAAARAGGAAPVDLLVIGDLMVDVVVHHDGPVAVGSDTPAIVRTHGGGSAANTAAWAGSLGLRTRLLAAIGDDDAGAIARRDLATADAELVGPVVPGAATGTCVVLVGPDRERTMFPDRGANAALTVADVEAALSAVPMLLHLSGYLLLGDDTRAAGLAAVAAAAERGVPVSVDAASAAPLRAVGAEAFLSWIAGVDLVFANDDEVDALGGRRAVLGAASELVAKHGSRGATWTDGERSSSVPAEPVATGSAVDTTGAGDAFAAGFLAARRRGDDVDACLALAARTAADAVGRVGARPPGPVGR